MKKLQSLMAKTRKVTFFMLFCLMAMMYATNSQAQKVTLPRQPKTVQEVMGEIERQTGYKFFYNNNLIDLSRRVTIKAKKSNLSKVLTQLFAGTTVNYKVMDKNIVLTMEAAPQPKPQSTINSSQHKVTGIITDSKGEPIIGATVKEKGVNNVGAITNMDGQFSLEVSKGATIEISYIGYKNQEVIIGKKNTINVVLREDNQNLDEVVVVGYGTQKKSDLIGSVGSVSNESMHGRAILSINQALMGKIAGVTVTPINGQPGLAPSVRVRGIGTFNNNDPLYVIDGVPISENGADIVNTQDIESIEVLKDAASASIYGSRAGNGVILITTKRGAEKKPIVTFDMSLGFNQAAKKLDLLNSSQFTMISDEALVNGGYDPYWKGSTGRADTNWQDCVFRNGFTQNYTLGVRGGKKDIRYYLSATYDNQDGSLIETNFKRYSIKSNVDVNVTDKLLVGMNLSYAWRKSTYIDTGVNSVLMNAVRMPSTVPAYNEDGSLGYPIGNEGDGQNPIGYAQRSKGPVNTNRLLINIFGDYKILPSLAFHSNFGADINYYRYTHFQPTFQNGNSHNDVNSLYESDSNTNSLSWENTLSFNKKFNNHDILVMIGNSIITSDYRYISASKSHFISNDDKMQYFDAGTKEDQVYGNRTDWAQLSYFGRINYNYANKYLAQFNIRRDGSSRFGKNNRWGTFPSIALGWRISEENFMKDVKWISNMKLRASYGVLGTQPTAVYGFTTSLDQYKYILGSNQDVVIGYAPSSKSNDDFKWETTDQTNLGLDLGFFKNSLNFTIEYYDKYTKGILQVLPLPSYSGMGGTLTNIGEMKNTGLELTCQYNNHVNDFNYNVGFNFSTLKNTVKKLFNDNSPIYGNYNRTEVGRSVGEFYGFVFDGIFQNQAEIDAYKAQPDAVPGDARFKDLDGNNVINEDDMDFLGSPLPKVTYGINLGFDYKGFDFVLFMQGVGGNKIYYSGKRYLIDGGNNFNKSTDILNRWQKEGDMTNIPRVSVKNSNDNFRRSSLFIENGSYLRINNIQLGYTLKKQWIKPIGLEKVRFYISVNNLATFTKYSGYDPAVDISDVFSPGDDQITYPVSRTFLAGFSLTF